MWRKTMPSCRAIYIFRKIARIGSQVQLERVLHNGRRRDRPSGDVDIHNYGSNIINSTGSALSILFDHRVTNASGKFHDPVMYLDTDGAGSDILLSIKRSEYVMSNLHIVCHRKTPS
jgi:hypothetical protein